MSCLDHDTIQSWLLQNPGWTREDRELVRNYRLPSFRRALALLVEMGCMAERADHHPALHLQYKLLAVRLSTHSAGGITEKDLRLAEDMDRAYFDIGGD